MRDPVLFRSVLSTSLGADLVTLAPGLRPERRFAPLARGLEPSDGKCLFYFLTLLPGVFVGNLLPQFYTYTASVGYSGLVLYTYFLPWIVRMFAIYTDCFSL